LHYRCLNTLEVDLQVLEIVITRVRNVAVLGENLANLSSLAPSPHDTFGAECTAVGIVDVWMCAEDSVLAAVRGPGDVDLGSRGTPNVRFLVLTDDHRGTPNVRFLVLYIILK